MVGGGNSSAGSVGAGGAAAQLASAVDGLTGLLSSEPALAFPALQELHDAMALAQALKGNNAVRDAMGAVEQAILDNPDAYAASMRQVHSADDLKKLFEDYSASNDLGPYGDLTLLVSLQLYYDETGNRAALPLIASTARQLRNLGNPTVFERLSDGSGEYLPLSAIQALTGRRYVWNQNQSMGILARGADYYGFTLYSSRVLRDRGGLKTEKMPRAAKYQAVLHIPEEYAYSQFGVTAVYLSNTTLGCICNDAILSHAQEILQLFLS